MTKRVTLKVEELDGNKIFVSDNIKTAVLSPYDILPPNGLPFIKIWRKGKFLDRGRVEEIGTHAAICCITGLKVACPTAERFNGTDDVMEGSLFASLFEKGDELRITNCSETDILRNIGSQ